MAEDWWSKIFPSGGENRTPVQKIFTLVSDRRMVVLQLAACIAAAIISRADLTSAYTWRVVAAIVGGLLLIIGFPWAYAGTLVYAADPAPANFRDAFRFRIGRMAWLLLGIVMLLVLGFAVESGLWALNYHDNYVWLISRAISITSEYLLPSLLLPWVAVRVIGNRLRDGLQVLRSWQYWVGMAVIVLVAEWISDLLAPGSLKAGSFWAEFVVIIRLAMADLPLIVGGVAAAGLVIYFVPAHRGSANLVGNAAS